MRQLFFIFIYLVLLFSYACDDEPKATNELAMAGNTDVMAGMVMGENMQEAGVEAGNYTLPDSGVEAGATAGMSAGTMAGVEAGMSAGTMAGVEAGMEAGTTAGMSAGAMAGIEAGTMAGMSAGVEAGVDAGTMAGDQVELKQCQVIGNWNVPTQSGVVYISHFESDELIWYRIDTEIPREEGRLALRSSAHDADIDEVHDRLAIAHDIRKEVALYQLIRPTNLDTVVEAPRLIYNIDTTPYTPRRVLFDTARQRLYVVANLPLNGELLTEMHLLRYDISNHNNISNDPESVTTIPVTTSVDIDERSGVLFLADLVNHTLHGYHTSNEVAEINGAAIDLRALLPETNNTGFDARNIQVDAVRGRVLLARAQGNLSETIVFAYPPINEAESGDVECADVLNYNQITHIPDQFDVQIDVSQRVNLLSAYTLIPVIGQNLMAFIHDAWNGFQSTSMLSVMSEIDGVVQMHPACQEFEGFGCFLRTYINESPISYQLTDGAGCVDRERLIFVATSYDLSDIEGAGQVYFYQYNAMNQMMSRLFNPNGRTHVTAAWPVNAHCH